MADKTPNPISDPERSSIRDSSPTSGMANGTDDVILLQRVRQGDQSAMAEVFDRYGRAVYSVALRILKDPGHAEDVMQDIFFQIWRNSDSFVQGRGSLGAWLGGGRETGAMVCCGAGRPPTRGEKAFL